MQQTKNGAARRCAYTLLNNPVKMFKVQPVSVEVPRSLKLDLNKRGPINPNMSVVPNFVGTTGLSS